MPDYVDDYATCHRTYATLVIVHPDLEPDVVTEGLGIQPSRAHRRGDIRNPLAKRPFIHPRGGWFLSSEGAVQSRDVRRHIDWLLDQVEPKGDVLKQLQYDHRLSEFKPCCPSRFDSPQHGAVRE
jgi:hypothetical protein